MSKSFRDLKAFQLACDLAVLTYRITRSFPLSERYGLCAQMQRASISIVSNIAEGQGRVTRGEFRQFLSQARGSLYELDAQCLIAHRMEFLTEADCPVITHLIKRTSAAVRGLIDSMR